jgi:hypothetical protein
MTTKHTPGPWHFGVETIGHMANYICAANTNTIVCADIDSAANARLIAAAPDLLAALQQCLVIVDAHRRAAGGEGDIAAMNARAAIARATL